MCVDPFSSGERPANTFQNQSFHAFIAICDHSDHYGANDQ